MEVQENCQNSNRDTNPSTIGQPSESSSSSTLIGLFTNEFLNNCRSETMMMKKHLFHMESEMETLKKTEQMKCINIQELEIKFNKISELYNTCLNEKEKKYLELKELQEQWDALNENFIALELNYDSKITEQTQELNKLKKNIYNAAELEEKLAISVQNEEKLKQQLQDIQSHFIKTKETFEAYQCEVENNKLSVQKQEEERIAKLENELEHYKNLNTTFEENKSALAQADSTIQEMTRELAEKHKEIVQLQNDKIKIQEDAEKTIAEHKHKIKSIERMCEQPSKAVAPLPPQNNTIFQKPIIPSVSNNVSATFSVQRQVVKRKRSINKRVIKNDQHEGEPAQKRSTLPPTKPPPLLGNQSMVYAFNNEWSSSDEDSNNSVLQGWRPNFTVTQTSENINKSSKADSDIFVAETSPSEAHLSPQNCL